MTERERTDTRRFKRSILIPIGILLAEILAITPLVEFRSGWMSRVASAGLLQTAMIGFVVYLSLRRTNEVQSSPMNPQESSIPNSLSSSDTITGKQRFAWGTIHLLLFTAFALLTLWWNDQQQKGHSAGTDIAVTALWCLLASAVGYSATRIVMTRKRLLRDLRLDWRGAVIAVSCAVLYAVFLRYREEVWRHTFQSTMYLAFWVLLKLQGAALLVVNNDGLPVFGNRDVRLLVTPFCAGNEAIIMFWLWWSALWSKPGFDRRCAEIWFHRLLAGTFLLWIVNVLRFDGLIWLGQWHGVQLAVRMAHSQLWFIIALCLSAMILRNPPLIDAESTKTTPHQMQGEGL